MGTAVKITVGEVELDAELFDTECAQSIVGLLPTSAPFKLWGDEIYFEIPYICNRDETATCDIEIGTIAYWPVGHAVCLFFGPTPMSSSRKPVPADRVNIIGRITGDPLMLRRAKGATRINIALGEPK
ncbi:MAG TPA: cyclophilin-like fold protein [Acidobacteriota bacterium]|nr:cyclophilin-like fold protein [Acidobacteriota bacterium]